MICALCKSEAELKNSHIIPEFLYKTMYDDKHRFHVLSTIPEQRNSMLQKGLSEKLLCAACESKLSKWERYASLVLKGGLSLGVERSGNLVIITDIDYSKFKLFQLSILWRASVSTLPFFKNVNLGVYEEKLRVMLVNSDAGKSNDFGCIMYGLKHEGVVTDLIVQPSRDRLNNITCYRFVYGGFQWLYMVSSQVNTKYNEAFIQPSGKAVFLVKNIFEASFISRFGAELIRMGRLNSPD
ncbi:hypothetical protein [Methylotenera sp. L2L1]|uniref:hypothetical protein n=1 Tax=Methylotenera sp. L2L1 TaxID=1502770 RepID=UPI00068AA5B3|nr:hypothetical protein [Methylotenera sp. L2L1]